MSAVPPQGREPQGPPAGLQAPARRGWLAHGLAALAISALGLGVAGSVALTTSAEPASGAVGSDSRSAQRQLGAAAPQVVPGTGALAPGSQEQAVPGSGVTNQAALAAFAPQQAPADDTAEADETVRKAILRERAAQRSEDLSEAAEEATRLTRTASQQARAKNLAATDREIRETAVRIATERRQRALAARIAAEVARAQAEAAATAAANRAAADTSGLSGTTSDDPAPPDTTSAPVGGNGVAPVSGAVVGTPFGATGLWARYHTGIDFRAAQGTPIRAVVSGVVVYAGNSGNWSGNHVAILHANGITTMSSHMSSIAVRVGERVSTGQVIGRVGQTGRAFGPHLHFEVYPRGVKYGDIYHAVNPVSWLRANGVRTR